jgi:integrase
LRLVENGRFDPFFGFFFEQNKTRYRSNAEKSKIKEKSWLAGTIRNSFSQLAATTSREALFPGLKRRNKRAQSSQHKIKPFPIELSVNLVRSKKPKKSSVFYRDMTLYSLLAATGMRTHEALQLRFIDIVTNEDGSTSIELHSPFVRPTPGISEAETETETETEQLAWKGRETSRTFMIEPFASIFWENLKKYLELEYNQSINHDFVFQKENGRPFFTSDRTTRTRTFKNYARAAGVQNVSEVRIHSLRHMYGTYILNYMPVPGNRMPGLPIVYVQRLMGHASSSSIQRYSKHDEDVLDAYIEHANRLVVVEGAGLENLMARVAEAKTHSEFFTPRLKNQLKAARATILKRSGDIHRLLEDEPKGFTLLDDFRGIIRSTCETLGLNLQQLAEEIEKPALIHFRGSEKALKKIFNAEAYRDV